MLRVSSHACKSTHLYEKVPLNTETLLYAREVIALTTKKLETLQHKRPYLVDVSLREPAISAYCGHSLQAKIEMLPKLRAFGFKDIILGSLDYAFPEELQVDDDFMMHLRDTNTDVSGCFALTDLGTMDTSGAYQPSRSQEKLIDYGVPHTFHEIYLTDDGMAGQYDFPTLCELLPKSVEWLLNNASGEHGAPPRIVINVVDGCDAFSENLERTCTLLSLLSTLAIEGVSIEEERGTFLPFQVGAFVKIARAILPVDKKLLVHIHSGAGFENATVIEALLQGADGVWAALPKRTAVNGHASSSELIANLLRLGNEHMQSYQLHQLLPLTTSLQEQFDEAAVPDDLPVVGSNAYCLPLTFFQQRKGRFMDLPPELIGGKYTFRICPVINDKNVIAHRLAEVTSEPAASFPDAEIEAMILLMRRDMRAGLDTLYDEPAEVIKLYLRAKRRVSNTAPLEQDN